MEKKEYPKWVYHSEHEPMVVKTEDDHKALGSEWVEVPFESESVEAENEVEAAPKKRARKSKAAE